MRFKWSVLVLILPVLSCAQIDEKDDGHDKLEEIIIPEIRVPGERAHECNVIRPITDPPEPLLEGCGVEEWMPLRPPEAISPRYNSWSMLLFCHPEWLFAKNNDEIQMLYERFKEFGHALGPHNVAVWFLGKSRDDVTADVARSRKYCRQFSLRFKKSPYFVVTTVHPNYSNKKNAEILVIRLSGVDAFQISNLLADVAELLVEERFAEFDKFKFWTVMAVSFMNSREILLTFDENVEVTLKTPILDVKITGSSD